MIQEFDPYGEWLGIPPSERPPNHYRLLGIALFESDHAIIVQAASERMTRVNSSPPSQHINLRQGILNEIVAARNCLCNSQAKATYDAELSRRSPLPRTRWRTDDSRPENEPGLPASQRQREHTDVPKPFWHVMVWAAYALAGGFTAIVVWLGGLALSQSSRERTAPRMNDKAVVAEKERLAAGGSVSRVGPAKRSAAPTEPVLPDNVSDISKKVPREAPSRPEGESPMIFGAGAVAAPKSPTAAHIGESRSSGVGVPTRPGPQEPRKSTTPLWEARRRARETGESPPTRKPAEQSVANQAARAAGHESGSPPSHDPEKAAVPTMVDTESDTAEPIDAEAVDRLKEAYDSAKTPGDFEEVARSALKVSDQATVQGKQSLARDAATLALLAARKAEDKELTKKATLRLLAAERAISGGEETAEKGTVEK